MKKSILIFIISVSLLSCNKNSQIKPVNPSSNKEAQKLLSFLYTISGKYTLSGQHNYAHELNKSSDYVKELTGKYPAVWGSDFGNKRARKDMINMAVRKYEEGNIITLMYHQGAPVKSIPDSVNPVRYVMKQNEWNDLIQPGTEINKLWLDDIDSVAVYLKILRDKNIPVLWRPYHEMNGTWFWWCDKKGDNGIKKLWKMMYERFVNYHHLNNLLWVWNANAPRDRPGDEAYAYQDYYPGGKYVDVLAADVYRNDYRQSHYTELQQLADGRPIALGEVSELPSAEILAEQPEWIWAMPWGIYCRINNSDESLIALYNDKRAITWENRFDKSYPANVS